MNDLLANMLRVPLRIAQLSADQVQKILDRNGLDRSADLPVWTGERDVDLPTLRANTGPTPNRSTETDALTAARFGDTKSRAVEGPPPAIQAVAAREALRRLDVRTIVAVGDGLLAGAGDFSWSSDSQQNSLVAQLAQHLGSELTQPLFQPPGVAVSLGRSGVQLRLPDLAQTTLYQTFPPPEFGNLAIPGFRVHDGLRVRPQSPVVQTSNVRQTLANLVLGAPEMANGQSRPDATQLERAVRQKPTLVLVAYGFDELMQAGLQDKISDLPKLETWQRDYAEAMQTLAEANCDLLILNVPSPLNTAAFSSRESAARVLRMTPDLLANHFGLAEGDYLTVAGLMEIGSQLNRGAIKPLESHHLMTADQAERLTSRVASLNELLTRLADRHKRAILCDAASVFEDFSRHGVVVGTQRLNSDYLGGLFSLNGYSLGATGAALLVNRVLADINESVGTSISDIQLEHVIATDPVASFRRAQGELWSEAHLDRMQKSPGSPAGTVGPGSRPARLSRKPATKNRPRSKRVDLKTLGSQYNSIYREPPPQRLQLPPGGRQTLPLSRQASYHSDAMRVIHCRQPTQIAWGTCGSDLFEGLAIFGSRLQGSLSFQFDPPVDHVSHFEIRLDGPLVGEDGVLSTPSFLRFPLLQVRVTQPSGMICSGEVDLRSGDISNLDFPCYFENSGLSVLQRMNPSSFPNPPVIRFKQAISADEGYGTAWARFVQRDDGRLDFLFHGTAFVPMGPGFRFALPLGSPQGDFASISADGTQLHPHLHLSTVEAEVQQPRDTPWIPTNSVHEFTANISRTCFGDDFTLNHPDFGFAQGRSHLAGRMLIQFGRRFGDLVPFTTRMLPPGGLMDRPSLSPLQQVFPGQLVPGMIGHDAVLRFPSRQYRQNDLYLVDDPFDVPVGAVNIHTGEVVGDYLHRALLGQALFFALVRVEPRTPQGSFEYRGNAVFQRGDDGQIIYRFNGTVFLPYREGFMWPLPDLANGVPVGPRSRLDPFFQVEAIGQQQEGVVRKSGGCRMQLSSMGERFSFQYAVSNAPGEHSTFEYTNHAQEGIFRLSELVSVKFSRSRASGDPDLVTLSGFGRWVKDKSTRICQVSAQISEEKGRPYVSILIDGGRVSNVNTKPKDELPPLTDLH